MRIFLEEVTIKAPLEMVFETISNPTGFQKASPQIQNIEFLSEQHAGEGTRFKETRIMRGKEVSTILEITEFEKNDFVRMVSEAGGTTWDTLFSVEDEKKGVRLRMQMTAIPNNFLARMANNMIGGIVRKGIRADMKRVKEFCELQAKK